MMSKNKKLSCSLVAFLAIFLIHTKSMAKCNEWFEPNWTNIMIKVNAVRTTENKQQAGWVDVSFSINKTGKVEDIIIIDSSNDGIFDKPLIQALEKWWFKPLVVDGVPKKQTCLRFMESFKKL